MIDEFRAEQLIGRPLRTRDGHKIGTIGQVYIDDYHGQPEWVMVDRSQFGAQESFVPLADATFSGDDLVVPYTRGQIKDAPPVHDPDHLTEAEEQDLYQHYNVAVSTEDYHPSAAVTAHPDEQR